MTRQAPAFLALALLALAGCGWTGSDLSPAESEGEGSAVPGTTAAGSGIATVEVDELPPEARATLELIDRGGPFPYSKDGAEFHNYEGLLPVKADSYYHEYTVITPGASDRGARRIVAGAEGERYYTDDHYSSFRLVLE